MSTEHEEFLSEIVSDDIDPSANVEWMRCSPDLGKYIKGLKSRCEKAEAAAAEMRWMCSTLLALVPEKPKAITWERGVEIINHCQDNRDKLRHASSTDCGKGWLSPEEYRERMDVAAKSHLQTIAELDAANAKLAIAVEALSRIQHSIHQNSGQLIAKDTLSKINAMPIVPPTGKPITEKEMEDKA